MRRFLFVLLIISASFAGRSYLPAQAHYAGGDSIVFGGATPRTLCYKLEGRIADNPLWALWIGLAIEAWGNANTGWKFKKCETEEENKNPDIQFSFNTDKEKKIPGGAQGGNHSGRRWDIVVEENVDGMDINGVAVIGGIDGWRTHDVPGEVTLDPVLVLEHELSHALGLDHTPNKCNTGDVEEPICAGNHGKPKARTPTASDIAEAKKAIQHVKDAEEEEKKKQAAAQTGARPAQAGAQVAQETKTDSASGTGSQICPKNEAPLKVGSNSAVGSGAHAKDKLVGTALGIVGGLLGGGGSKGPALGVCRIRDSEMSLFEDPQSGVALRVGARRNGEAITVFADVASSADSGTFQTAFLRNGRNDMASPSAVGICKLWGDWSLSVSWTRTTTVNNQIVDRQSGGFSKAGTFSLPGTVSSDAAPDGIWKRLGFSNASHGAQTISMTYAAPRETFAAPVMMVVHVTRPGQDPVMTVPFILAMSETPAGFSFARRAQPPCGASPIQ